MLSSVETGNTNEGSVFACKVAFVVCVNGNYIIGKLCWVFYQNIVGIKLPQSSPRSCWARLFLLVVLVEILIMLNPFVATVKCKFLFLRNYTEVVAAVCQGRQQNGSRTDVAGRFIFWK